MIPPPLTQLYCVDVTTRSMWSDAVEEAVVGLLTSSAKDVRRVCFPEILGPQLPAEVSSTLPPYLSVLCSVTSHYHPDNGEYTSSLPEVFEECSDDAGGP